MAPIHNHMPAIIPEESYDRWLSPQGSSFGIARIRPQGVVNLTANG